MKPNPIDLIRESLRDIRQQIDELRTKEDVIVANLTQQLAKFRIGDTITWQGDIGVVRSIELNLEETAVRSYRCKLLKKDGTESKRCRAAYPRLDDIKLVKH